MAVVECFPAYSQWQTVVIVQASIAVLNGLPSRNYWVALYALQLHRDGRPWR